MEIDMAMGTDMDMDMGGNMEVVIIWKKKWVSGRFSIAFSVENKKEEKVYPCQKILLQFFVCD